MEKIAFDKYLRNHKYHKFDLKAILFDMDGVLFDSMKWHDKSWKMTMDHYNLPYSENEFYIHEGRVGHNTIRFIIEREQKRIPSIEEVNEMYMYKTDLFASLNDKSLIPYAKDMVNLTCKNNLLCTLVTGSGQHSLLETIKDTFDDAFDKERMVTAFDVKKGKPDPEPYLIGLKKSGNLKANQAIVIENAPRGIESAKAAGIFTIAINTGPLNPQILSDAGADIVLPSMKALYGNFNSYLEYINHLKI